MADMQGMLIVILLYYSGEGVPQSHADAAGIARRLVMKDMHWDVPILGSIRKRSKRDTVPCRCSGNCTRRLVMADMQGMFQSWVLYDDGKGVSQSYKMQQLYKKACDGGDAGDVPILVFYTKTVKVF